MKRPRLIRHPVPIAELLGMRTPKRPRDMAEVEREYAEAMEQHDSMEARRERFRRKWINDDGDNDTPGGTL